MLVGTVGWELSWPLAGVSTGSKGCSLLLLCVLHRTGTGNGESCSIEAPAATAGQILIIKQTPVNNKY